MIKYLLRIMVCVVIGAVLLSAAYEGYLRYKGDEVSVEPMGIVFVYRYSFIGDSYVYSDMELPNGIRINRLVTFNTSWFLWKMITNQPVTDLLLINASEIESGAGEDKVEAITTLKDELLMMERKGASLKETIFCVEREKLSPERLAVCELSDEYYKQTIKKFSFKKKVDGVRGAIQKNQEKKKNEITL